MTGLFTWSPTLPVTYIDNKLLVTMIQDQIWEADLPDLYCPWWCLAIIKVFPAAPQYGLCIVYVPALQAQLTFGVNMKALHNLSMEPVALVYILPNCPLMPEPSSGEHYTLLPLTGDPNISIGALQTFMTAKLTVASRHGWADMGVQLKLPPCFGP